LAIASIGSDISSTPELALSSRILAVCDETVFQNTFIAKVPLAVDFWLVVEYLIDGLKTHKCNSGAVDVEVDVLDDRLDNFVDEDDNEASRDEDAIFEKVLKAFPEVFGLTVVRMNFEQHCEVIVASNCAVTIDVIEGWVGRSGSPSRDGGIPISRSHLCSL
jgi:hypothetical protein